MQSVAAFAGSASFGVVGRRLNNPCTVPRTVCSAAWNPARSIHFVQYIGSQKCTFGKLLGEFADVSVSGPGELQSERALRLRIHIILMCEHNHNLNQPEPILCKLLMNVKPSTRFRGTLQKTGGSGWFGKTLVFLIREKRMKHGLTTQGRTYGTLTRWGAWSLKYTPCFVITVVFSW